MRPSGTELRRDRRGFLPRLVESDPMTLVVPRPVDRSLRPAPMALKVGYSVFVAMHLLVNLRFYGPMNYLWFCDIAVLTTAIALWTGNRLLMSMSAVSMIGSSVVWCIDLASRLLLHRFAFGFAGYMFSHDLPLPIRLASTFHLWLPLVQLEALRRWGYDRRALLWQTVVAVLLLVVCRLVSRPPPAADQHDLVNINWVYGTSDTTVQTQYGPWEYIGLMILRCWVFMYLPIHLVLRMTVGRSTTPASFLNAGGGFAQTDEPSSVLGETTG